MIKRSRQREAIRQCLTGRYDHPTAETVYMSIKDEFPNISLGTVYRNLSLLSDLGEIQKITVSGGPDRFDGNPAPHYHFSCRECGCVMDLDMPSQEQLNQIAAEQFDGTIENHSILFSGLCPDWQSLYVPYVVMFMKVRLHRQSARSAMHRQRSS